MRSEVAASRVATAEDHEALATDTERSVLDALARAPRPWTCSRLARSRLRTVRAVVATNALLPQEELEGLLAAIGIQRLGPARSARSSDAPRPPAKHPGRGDSGAASPRRKDALPAAYDDGPETAPLR